MICFPTTLAFVAILFAVVGVAIFVLFAAGYVFGRDFDAGRRPGGR